VANANKLPALTKALPAFKGELLAVVYWGTAPEEHVQVFSVMCEGSCQLALSCQDVDGAIT
jgi:hypothetical protein